MLGLRRGRFVCVVVHFLNLGFRLGGRRRNGCGSGCRSGRVRRLDLLLLFLVLVHQFLRRGHLFLYTVIEERGEIVGNLFPVYPCPAYLFDIDTRGAFARVDGVESDVLKQQYKREVFGNGERGNGEAEQQHGYHRPHHHKKR